MTAAGPEVAFRANPRRGADGGWPADADALIAEARRRRRRRWRRQVLTAAVALLLAAAAAGSWAGLSGTASHRPGRDRSASGPASPMPSQVVVWTSSFRIEVLSAGTGHVLRTLATRVALYQGLPTVAVSSAGTVYFDDGRGRREWVMSVPLAGGPVTTLAGGREPAVSPDGRLLAYVTGGRVTGATGAPEAIVVRNLATGTQRRWAFSSARPGRPPRPTKPG